MKSKKSILKFIALALSLLLIFSAVPLSVFAEGEFVSENLLQTKIDTDNSSGVIWYRNGRTIEDSTARGLDNAVTGLVDGDLTKTFDISAYGIVEYRCFGIRYALTETSYVSSFKMYGDYSNLPNCYDIYVSDTLETLHYGGNYIGTVECNGTAQTISVNRDVKYLLVLFNSIKSNSDYCRPIEVQLWSGDASAEFTPTNLVKSDKLDSYSAISVSGESATAYPSNNAKVQTVVTNDITNSHTDLYSNASGYTGIQFNLTELTYVGKVLIDAGIYINTGAYNEKYTVYASPTVSDLYSEKNIISADVLCQYSSPEIVEINKYVQYIAIACTEHGGVRIRNVLIYDAYADPDIELPFISENVLKDNLSSARCVQFYPSNYYVDPGTRIGTDKIATFNDGNTSATSDCYSGLDWDPVRYIGVEFTLDDTYFVGDINIYSGYTTSKDTFDVYASDSMDTLYSAASLVESGVVCEGSKVTLPLNKTVKYVTFLISGVELYCARIAEFELWTADDSAVFIPENLFQTSLESKTTMAMRQEDSVVIESEKFDQTGALEVSVDGNFESAKAVYDCIGGWEHPIYPGAVYTLKESAFADYLTIYAGGKFRVYASDTMDSLYQNYSCITESTDCVAAGTKIEIKRAVKYVAVMAIGYADVTEFVLMSGDDSDAPEPPVSDLSVLTIGNSFSENTSVYASEIAYANGKNLTFGYLKSPSCSIAKHYNAAVNNIAGFKFQVTEPDGNGGITKITVKKGDSAGVTVDNPNAENGATIAEALAYTDWDVIVFQQESSSARNYDTFADLANLVNYVKEKCPNAKLMFHEVWRWGEWEVADFANIKANSEKAARENGLGIIPSGLAFEYARELTNVITYPNENDGHYQHANTYGQYLAGVCYVDALFGIECDGTKFAAHPYINADNNIVELTACANNASRYYKSYGDIDFNGEINADDCALLINVVLGALENVDMTLADANNDGVVNIIDLVFLKKYLANNEA